MTAPQPQPAAQPLAAVRSIKVKLGLLVGVSVLVATVLATTSNLGGVAPWLAIPVTVLLALGVTQLLAVGMTSPLRRMTEASRRMAAGDYSVRVPDDAADEVGELARAFNTMAGDLAAEDAHRRALVATVAHELRTPLTGMVAVLENLEDGVVAPEPAAIASARAQAERLSDLVRDLLDLSRYDAGAARLDVGPVPVAALVRRAVAEAETLGATLGRTASYDVRVTPADLVVRGDEARLHQVLANLLDNASRHTSAGGTIRVSAEQVGDRWRLAVANPGEPVAAADRERAFERFGVLGHRSGHEPGHELGDRSGGGTGLGLAITRWVVQLHGGTVGFADPQDLPDPSAPAGAGALVVADLPLDPFPTTGAPVPAAPPVPPRSVPPVQEAPAAPPAVAPVLDLVPGWPASRHPGSVGLVLASVGVGLLAALLVVDQLPGLGYVLTLLAGGAAVWAATGWRRDPFTLACGGLAALLVSVLMLRDAVWIGVLCTLAASALCLAGSTRARSLRGLATAGLAWAFAGLHGLPWIGRSLRRVTGSGHSVAVARTALFSLTGVVVFGLLFASADALFRSWVDAVVPDVTLGDVLVARIFTGLFVAALVLVSCYLALNPPRLEPDTPAGRRPVQRRYEWLVPVLLVDAVFVLFLAAQATAVFGGHDYLRRTTDLTYADYVHQGFGQLTTATFLTLLVVSVAARKAATVTVADRAWLRGALGLLCVLTLVVVGSALHRLDLYQQAYGLTRLRLTVAAFEIWLGILVVGLLLAGLRLAATWLPRVGLLSGATVLLVLALLDPDALIAERNIAVEARTGRVDLTYLAGLSADATPTLAGWQRWPDVRTCSTTLTPDDDDLLSWNLGRSRARSALADAPAAGAC